MGVDRYSRQSFLGLDGQDRIAACVVGIVGLGGGGSHIVQQLAHLGFCNFLLYDPDFVEESNLNRLIGGTEVDATDKRSKIEVATRLILGLQPRAFVQGYTTKWQDNALPLRGCDLLFGCVDGLAERQQLEATARRFMIPYIDIGLDIHTRDDAPPVMAGQVVLSMPGELCFRCLGFLNDTNLAREAARYGDAGIRPQVVSANGVLASTAVGLVLEIVTGWAGAKPGPVYLQYHGNDGTVQPHVRMQYLRKDPCPHYPNDQVGDPIFRPL